ncbi:thermonuclease family protein [Citricoccus sp. K5]|uniref:thermonuclease family protein n=1 Tax=Citricoccus sp. K5 TaxID=2653135 RepID=UPI0013594187|nr:thermonuclease family protein [Citricoccus sp. K5]
MTAKVVTGVAVVAVVAVAAGATGVAVAQSGGSDDRDRATVVRVIDGDTIDADVNGEIQRVRLLNVDTPETKHPEKPVQCLGPEATAFLEELLAPGEQIELVYDVERTDRYDRTLAGVYKDDSLINADVAEAGLGVAVLYEPNDRFYPEVLEAQERAEEAGKGLHDAAVECTVPALAEALPPLEDLPAAIPADAAGVAAALAAAAPVIAAGEALGAALDLVESGGHVVLSRAYGGLAPELRKRSDVALPAAVAYQQELLAKEAELAEEARVAAEKAAQEKLAAEKAAAEKKAAEERAVAEQKAAEERAAEEARQAEQDRAAEAERQEAEAERQADRARERENARQAERNHSNERQPETPRRQPPSNSGYGTDADFPGYTGPRCYAPGGQAWKPC